MPISTGALMVKSGLVWLYSNNKIKVTQNDARESGVEANGAIALQLVEAPGLVICSQQTKTLFKCHQADEISGHT